MNQSTESVASKLLLLYLLWSSSESDVDAFECIDIPPAPVNGRLLGPFGTLVARLVCPSGQDIALNTRRKGLLECNPMKKPYSLIGVPRHKCLPMKVPDSFVMYVELTYFGVECSPSLKYDMNVQIKSKMAGMNISNDYSHVNVDWDTVTLECGENEAKQVKSPEDKFRYDVRAALKIWPYKPGKSYVYYVDLLQQIKRDKFNRVDLLTTDTTPQDAWKLSGFKLQSTSYSPLFSSCDRHSNTVGVNVEYNKIASCRGCSRDYALDRSSKRCTVCSVREYTQAPFSNTCVPCPNKRAWHESAELYADYCERMQAEYDNNDY